MIRAIRGGITVAEDTPDAIGQATREMLAAILARNGLAAADIVSVTFTATGDLTAAYPAAAARAMGLVDAALMCVQEMHVAGSLAMCLRVCVLAEMGDMPARHVYLKGAAVLRPDLTGEEA